MERIIVKLKEIYLRYLLVSIGTILLYTGFRWLFDIKLGLLPLKEDVLNFWIPFVLPWIPILLWMRRPLRILNLQGKRDNGQFLYQFLMAIAIAVPTVQCQNYLEKASYDLIRLNTVEEIKNHPDEKYFEIASFDIEMERIAPYVTIRVTGKNNRNLNYHLYLSCPFQNANNLWYGVEYSKSLNNSLSDEKKNAAYSAFLEESERMFKSYNFYTVSYFERLGYTNDWDGYIEGILIENPSFKEEEQVIVIPHDGPFEARMGNTLKWIFGTFGFGSIVLFFMVVLPKINEAELKDFKNNKPLKEDALKDFVKFLNPNGPFRGTALLLLLNMAVFIFMVFSGMDVASPSSKELLEIGGNRRFEVLSGDYWRLLSSVFIHGGILHLLMNLFGLGIAGSFLERIIGWKKLLFIFMVCGVIASVASIYWHENTVSVGASGAIFGLYGVILVFSMKDIYPHYMVGTIWMILGLYGGGSLLFGLFGGVDNAAHVGGLICGLLTGLLLIAADKDVLKKKANEK